MPGPLTLMCTLAVRGAFDAAVVPAFERAGHAASITWAPTTVLMESVAAGQRPDVIVLVSEAMDDLAGRGIVDARTRVEVARSGLGVAVRAGAPHPDLGSAASFQQALLDARSVAYSLAGASGIYFRQMIGRLGIAEAVNRRATVIATGFTAEKLVSGEADVAVQQLSELMAVPGIEIAGRFPAGLQTDITLSAAMTPTPGDRGAAETFLALLRTDEALAAYAASGLDPVVA